MEHHKIKFGDKEFDASEYQDSIFDMIEHGIGNIVISAAAGASKTTTIVNCIDLINVEKRIVFLAFNKEIVETIRKRVGDRDKTHISTFHSLGYSIFNENFPDFHDSGISEFKYRNYIKNNINKLSSISFNNLNSSTRTKYIDNITTLVDYSRYYLMFKESDIKKIGQKYGMVLIGDEASVCRKVLEWGEKNTEQIDYTDMIWLPNVLNLTTKKHLYDYIFIDEAQDISIMELRLVEKCTRRGTRFISCGDEFQQINMWCGSSDDAMNLLKAKPNTTICRLPISYRCPKLIVEAAKKYSDNIQASEDAIDGVIRRDVSENMPVAGDMVLCRNTAPLIALHLRYIRLNKKSYLKGCNDIKEKYMGIIRKCDAYYVDHSMLTSDGLFPKLYTMLIEERDKVKRLYGLDDEDSSKHESVLEIYDTIEGLKVLSEGLVTVSELIDKISAVFGGDNSNAIMLSTVHKSKGLEADNIFILNPSLMPSPIAKLPWEVRTENNLIYVAITRAKKSLNYIKETVPYWSTVSKSMKSLPMIKDNIDRMQSVMMENTPSGKVTSTYEMNEVSIDEAKQKVPEKAENRKGRKIGALKYMPMLKK